MYKNWHSLNNFKETDSEKIFAEATLEPESFWFDGHFPGTPILPGIAQLAIAYEAIQKYAQKRGNPIKIERMTRVRFRQFIKPGVTIQVTAAPEKHDPSIYKFKLMVDGQVVCNGFMKTAPVSK